MSILLVFVLVIFLKVTYNFTIAIIEYREVISMKKGRRTGLIMRLKPEKIKDGRLPNLLCGLMATFYTNQFGDVAILFACEKLNLTLPSPGYILKDYLAAYCNEHSPLRNINFLRLLRYWRDMGLAFDFKLLFGISLEQVIDIHTDLIVDDYQKLVEANTVSPSLAVLQSQLKDIFQKAFSLLGSNNLSPNDVLPLNDILIGITRALSGKYAFRNNQKEAA
jgi:hypothetical protein